MSEKIEIQKTYNPSEVEDGIYKKWEESGYFNPDKCFKDGIARENAGNFSIIMPPPNVTGVLHMGSAMMLVVEDIMARHNRMRGKKTLWLPGTDHAAIATQTRVEKILKEEGLSRHILGREKFLERVNEFVEQQKNRIKSQMRKMGSSCDWSREAYTMDETRNKAVKTVFKMMYDDGLIYRGERIVNWCPRCHSTLADDEVEHKEQKTKLWTFRYSKDFPFAIATTRPETKLGDTAVAVNPKDQRYKEYIGKIFEVDFCGIKLKLRIIADRNVDMNFGTGVLGVTPAHSMVDWEMARENGLEIVKVINEDGNVRECFGEFSGKTANEARNMIVEKLKTDGLIEKEEEIDNSLSLCYRCDTPIEPLPSLQWFIDVNKDIPKYKKSIKTLCLEAVSSGVFGREKINIIPDRFEKSYFTWMENLRDWCISRQIWFGHRIPVWYKNKSKVESQKSKVVEEEIYVGDEAPEGEGWAQDTDTLDTWFSSGMWTFSTMANKPEQIRVENGKLIIDNEDFKNFHPTSVLETMYDILFFWVARMIIMTTYAVEDIPFQDVYMHGCVRDKFGDKMSKSKPETCIDPLEVCDKYGTDAVRLSLIIGAAPGSDTKVFEEKIAGARNFTNKLWNISRYISGKFKVQSSKFKVDELNLTLADRWILGRLDVVINEVDNSLDNYQFSQAGEILKDFTWNDFADWYIEISKFEEEESKGMVLKFVLENLLKLWHPFMPFVTEKIWQEMGNEKMLMIEKWPKYENQKTPLGAMSFSAESSGVEPHSNKESLRYQLRAATARQYSPDVSADLLYQNTNKKQSQNFRTVSYRSSLNVAPQVDTCNQDNISKNFVKFSKNQEINQIEDDFNLIKNIITSIRTARCENKIEPLKKIKVVICAGERKELIESQAHLIKNLKTGIGELEIKSPQPPFAKGGNIKPSPDPSAGGEKIKNAIYITVNGFDIYLIGAVDFEKERERINGEIEEVKKYIRQIEGKLSNQEFVNNAPEAVVKKEKEKLSAQRERLEKLGESFGSLQE